MSWPAWFKPVQINGVEFSPLTTSAELSQEGSIMRHCVGSYAPRCVSSETQIISCCLDGERVTTLELRAYSEVQEDRNTLKFRSVQHLAKFNDPPPRKVKSAVTKLVKLLNGNDKIAQRVLKLIEEAKSNRPKRYLCGFDHQCPKEWEKASLEFLPYLPVNLQKLQAAELAELIVAQVRKGTEISTEAVDLSEEQIGEWLDEF